MQSVRRAVVTNEVAEIRSGAAGKFLDAFQSTEHEAFTKACYRRGAGAISTMPVEIGRKALEGLGHQYSRCRGTELMTRLQI